MLGMVPEQGVVLGMVPEQGVVLGMPVAHIYLNHPAGRIQRGMGSSVVEVVRMEEVLLQESQQKR